MFRNYIVSALRHLKRNVTASVLNICGLALGMATCLIILFTVNYELGYDQFHSDNEKIFRLVRVEKNTRGEQSFRGGICYPLAVEMRTSMNGITATTSIYNYGGIQITLPGDERSTSQPFQVEGGCAFADEYFFQVFDFGSTDKLWMEGSPQASLQRPFTMVITKSLAEKYFPNGGALGSVVTVDNEFDFEITGIIRDLPSNTDFPFEVFLSYASLKPITGDWVDSWVDLSDDNYVFVKSGSGNQETNIESQIDKIHRLNAPGRVYQERSYKLQPLEEMHADARFGNFNFRTVNQNTILVMLTIGIFVLITACINFINLSTAHAVTRAKEVGLRKVLGGNRHQLIFQFLGESMITAFISGIMALGISELFVKLFPGILHITPGGSFALNSLVMIIALIIILSVGILAGIYPALILSSYSPVDTFRHKMTGINKGGLWLRKSLILFQFIISQAFVFCTIIVIMQIAHFRNFNLGFDTQAIINVFIPERNPTKIETLKNELLRQAGIQAVSFNLGQPAGMNRAIWSQGIRNPEQDINTNIIFEYKAVDEAYIDLFDIGLLAGRNFMKGDSGNNVILNERLVRQLGFGNPASAIGELIKKNRTNYTVVGVIENFQNKSLKDNPDNIALFYNPNDFYTTSIKLTAGSTGGRQDLSQQIATTKTIWEDVFPGYVFNYTLLQDDVWAYYREEARISRLFQIFGLLTIFIGCLGLFGLISFMAHRKVKEIGIRKVFGARVANILYLFGKEFMLLIVLAMLIAIPVTYLAMTRWLENFVHHIQIGPAVFVLGILITTLIVLLTAGYRSLRAALANPVDTLRNE